MIRIKVKELCKDFYLKHNSSKTFYEHLIRRQKKDRIFAIKGINLSINSGECIGIIGRNGSGKSTLLKLIAGLIKPTSGHIEINGTVMPLLDLSFGFDNELSGPENIKMFGLLLGLSEREIEQRMPSIIEYFGFPKYLDSPIKYYSDGMKLRLAFSTVMVTNPDILLIDEALLVGDATFQRRCQAKIMDLRKQKKTMIIVSHDLKLLNLLCERIILLDNGSIKKEGNPYEISTYYNSMIENEDLLDIEEKLSQKEDIIATFEDKWKAALSENLVEEAAKAKIILDELNHEYIQFINECILIYNERKKALAIELEKEKGKAEKYSSKSRKLNSSGIDISKKKISQIKADYDQVDRRIKIMLEKGITKISEKG